MRKIGNKLLITYLIILLVAFIVTTFSFNVLSRRYLMNEARNQLASEGEQIADILKNVNMDEKNLRSKLAIRPRLAMVGRFIDAEILVLNKDRKPIYRNIEDFNSRDIFNIMSKQGIVKGYVARFTPIYDRKGDIKGYVLLMTKLKNINALNKLNRQAQILSLIIAGVIALIIAIFFEKSLIGPIRKLKEKISSFSIKSSYDYPDIKTGDEIEELDKSFTDMAKRLKYYDDQRKRFFQNTSHELKTPLMSIQGYAEAIKDGIVEGKEFDESLDIIIKESQRLKKTVDEIIYLTKLENVEDNFKFSIENLSEIISKAIKSINSLANENDIKIDTEIDREISGEFDREKLIRAFINILGNGIRYADSKIKIQVHEKNDIVEIIIIDDGIGFKEGEEEKIFDRFYKGINGNTGLGLAITKSIIEGHNGVISAYNNSPRGAVFKVELPKR